MSGSSLRRSTAAMSTKSPSCCAISSGRSSGRGAPRRRHNRQSRHARVARPELIPSALQVIGIWLQLLSIAEENAAMRARRRLEAHGGQDQLIGSLSNAFSTISSGRHRARARRPRAGDGLYRADHHRASDRSQARQRARNSSPHLSQALRNGEPAVDAARAPGADAGAPRRYRHAVDDRRNQARKADRRAGNILGACPLFKSALFERTPQFCDLFESALARHYPELGLTIKPPLRFASWIGGDRDGNPFVTVSATKYALSESRKAAVERLDRRLSELAELISVSSSEVTLPAGFRERLSRQLALSGDAESIAGRNANEPFRQYFTALRARLAATFVKGSGTPCRSPIRPNSPASLPRPRRRSAIQAGSIARNVVRPVRWEVQIFGFRTMSLDPGRTPDGR